MLKPSSGVCLCPSRAASCRCAFGTGQVLSSKNTNYLYRKWTNHTPSHCFAFLYGRHPALAVSVHPHFQ